MYRVKKKKIKKLKSNAKNAAYAGGTGPPATGSRDHLKIEKDGRLINRAMAPGTV